jgi:hypothetical protein
MLLGSLYNDAFSVTRLYRDDVRISELWWIGRDLVGSGCGLILKYYPGFRLDGLRKTTKKFSRDSRGPESNPGPPEYEVGVLTTQPWGSVM